MAMHMNATNPTPPIKAASRDGNMTVPGGCVGTRSSSQGAESPIRKRISIGVNPVLRDKGITP